MGRRSWIGLTALLVVAGACSSGTTSSAGVVVDVKLQEFAILPDISSVAAGPVTFSATNDGPDDPHELVVFKTDLDVAGLPTKEDGAVDEAGEGVELIGEIEEFAVGETEAATFDLDAGAYVLICNLVELHDGTTEVHYALGMRTAFTVT